MKQLLVNFGIAVILSSLLTMVMVSAIPVRADGIGSVTYNTQTVILQGKNISTTGGKTGQNGYGVFNPGVIGYVTATLKAPAIAPNLIVGTPYRRGSTDAWLNFVITPPKPFGSWDHFGGHSSSSDLWEGEIWVDGFLKITNDASWRATCANHSVGSSAYCVTSFNQLVARLIKAKTNHHFHKGGYIDNNFSTADNA